MFGQFDENNQSNYEEKSKKRAADTPVDALEKEIHSKATKSRKKDETNEQEESDSDK